MNSNQSFESNGMNQIFIFDLHHHNQIISNNLIFNITIKECIIQEWILMIPVKENLLYIYVDLIFIIAIIDESDVQ